MTRPMNIPDPWRSLAVKLGGVQLLADALHSSPRTINRWANSQRMPRGPALELIRQVFAANGIEWTRND